MNSIVSMGTIILSGIIVLSAVMMMIADGESIQKAIAQMNQIGTTVNESEKSIKALGEHAETSAISYPYP